MAFAINERQNAFVMAFAINERQNAFVMAFAINEGIGRTALIILKNQ